MDAGRGGDDQYTIKSLKESVPVEIPIRSLLEIFNLERRSPSAIADIESVLTDNDLTTVSPIAEGTLDSLIGIKTLNSHAAESLKEDQHEESKSSQFTKFTFSVIPSATTNVISVSQETLLKEAMFLMMRYNFSQLPVLDEGALRGTISWRSICNSLSNSDPKLVKDVMEADTPLVYLHNDLQSKVEEISDRGFVLVLGDNNDLSGIVTASDLTDFFGKEREPLSQIEEIELRIRRQYKQKVLSELETGQSSRSNPSLGYYVNNLKNQQQWELFGWNSVPQDMFTDMLDRIREIRNELAHWSQDPIEESKREEIRQMLRVVRALDGADDDDDE